MSNSKRLKSQSFKSNLGHLACNIRIVMKYELKNLIRILISMQLIFGPLVAYAEKIEFTITGDALRMRALEKQGEQGNVVEAVDKGFTLDRGSVVEADIPNHLILREGGLASGKIDREKTLLNWLNTIEAVKFKPAGGTKNNCQNKAGFCYDYFGRIKVKSVAGRSNLPANYSDLNLGAVLRSVRLRGTQSLGDRISLNVVEPTPVVNLPDRNTQQEAGLFPGMQEPSAAKVADAESKNAKSFGSGGATQSTVEAQTLPSSSSTEAGYCFQCTITERSTPVEKLLTHLPESTKRIEANVKQKIRNFHDNELVKRERIEKSCGIKYDDYYKFMVGEADKMGLDGETVFKYMLSQESASDCYATRGEGGSRSIGLLQINIEGTHPSSSVPLCSSNQISQLKTAGMQGLMADAQLPKAQRQLQCLQNPLVNGHEALRIFKEKEDYLISGGVVGGRRNGSLVSFDRAKLAKSPDRLPLMVAAFNGGQHWILDAKYDLEQFNLKNAGVDGFTPLDPYNYDHLKLFNLMGGLEPDELKEVFGNTALAQRQRRSWGNSLSNTAHTEAIRYLTQKK